MRELINPEGGENRAVRAFLLCYGSQPSVTVNVMRSHMIQSGWPLWPAWTTEEPGYLTKAGAQDWLRHLFALEPAVSWQVRRRGHNEPWETCTEDLYERTRTTGRYNAYENGPEYEVRALCLRSSTSP